MIVCNGCPKSGTNLLQKLCGMLGLRDSAISLVGFGANRGLSINEVIDDQTKQRATDAAALDLPDEYFAHAHVTAINWPVLARQKVLVALRDPRDCAVSLIRWIDRRYDHVEANERVLIDLLLCGYWPAREGNPAHTWVWLAGQFAAWPLAPSTHLCIEFEDMGRPETVERVVRFLGVECDAEEIAAHWLGNGKNYRGRPMYRSMSSYTGPTRSNWREWWTPAVEEAWRATRGPELLEVMGYA